MGNVDIAGCVSRRSSLLQVISPGASAEWPLRSRKIKNALLRANGFDLEVHLRAPCKWNSRDTRRAWKLRAPAYELNDATVAVHRSLHTYSANSAESLSSAGLRVGVPSFDPCMYPIYRKSEKAAGVITTHNDDILGRGEPDLL